MDRELAKIVRAAEKTWGAPAGSVMLSTRGSIRAVKARREAWWRRWKQTKDSWSQLGREFGRDRSTIRDGVRAFEAYVSTLGPYTK